VPDSLTALAIVVASVLPGSMYTWAYERQTAAYGVTLADRTLRFIAISLIFHLVLGWPEYGLYRKALASESFHAGQFAIAWVGAVVLVAVPAVLGTVIGGLYATRSTRTRWTRLRKVLSRDNERRLFTFALGRAPAPRAWDHLFSDSPYAYLRVGLTTADVVIGGLFADKSYAGGHPHEADLLLEDMWEIDVDGETLVRSLGYPVYVPATQIAWIEVIPQQDEDGTDG
jgi:hypothetical protein